MLIAGCRSGCKHEGRTATEWQSDKDKDRVTELQSKGATLLFSELCNPVPPEADAETL